MSLREGKTRMLYIGLYIATAVIFLALDAIWLRKVAMPMFQRHVGGLMLDDPDLKVAAIFYALYCAGVVYFAAAPAVAAGAPGLALQHGFVLGLLAYGTYEATNKATLKGWHWQMVVSDTLWGAVLTGVSAWGAAAIFA